MSNHIDAVAILREAFEADMRKRKPLFPLELNFAKTGYMSPGTQHQWEGWQAAAFNTGVASFDDEAVRNFVSDFEIDTGEGIYQLTENDRFVLEDGLRTFLSQHDMNSVTTERAATQPAGSVQGIPTWKDRARYDRKLIESAADQVPYMQAELADLRNRLAAPISEDTANDRTTSYHQGYQAGIEMGKAIAADEAAPISEGDALPFFDTYDTGVKPWSQRIPPNSESNVIADAMQDELNELRHNVKAARTVNASIGEDAEFGRAYIDQWSARTQPAPVDHNDETDEAKAAFREWSRTGNADDWKRYERACKSRPVSAAVEPAGQKAGVLSVAAALEEAATICDAHDSLYKGASVCSAAIRAYANRQPDVMAGSLPVEPAEVSAREAK